MNRRLAALSAVPLMLMLAGCGSVQEAAETAAGDASSKVATAAADEVKKQVCAVVQDGLVSVEDKAVLGVWCPRPGPPAYLRKSPHHWARSPRPATRCPPGPSRN
jgi:uncharacterized protein YceK